jgi:hypothetical protein
MPALLALHQDVGKVAEHAETDAVSATSPVTAKT